MATRGSVLMILLFVSSSPAQEKKSDPKPGEITPATIKEWKWHGFLHAPAQPLPVWEERGIHWDWRFDFTPPGENPPQPRGPTIPRFVQVDGPLYGSPPDPGVPFQLYLKGSQKKPLRLDQLVDLESLVFLDVWLDSTSGVRGPLDADLEYVAELRNLTHLSLVGCGDIRGPGLKHLASMKKLIFLDLTETKVRGAWLRHLATIPSLETLVLNHIGSPENIVGGESLLTDDGLRGVAELRQVKHLSLAGNIGLTDAGLRHLSRLDNLVALNLDRVKVTDAGLKHVSGLKNLRQLKVYGPDVTDPGIKDLSSLKNLTHLELRDVKMSEAGLKDLATLTSITHLNLYPTQLPEDGVAHLATLGRLTTLDLFSDSATGKGLKGFATHNKLTRLALSAATDGGLEEVGTLKSLTKLDLWGQFTDAGLKHLAGLHNLTRLVLHNERISEAGLKDLRAVLPKCNIVRR